MFIEGLMTSCLMTKLPARSYHIGPASKIEATLVYYDWFIKRILENLSTISVK